MYVCVFVDREGSGEVCVCPCVCVCVCGQRKFRVYVCTCGQGRLRVCVCVCVDRGGRGEVWEGIGMGPGHHTNPDPRCQRLSQQDRTQES